MRSDGVLPSYRTIRGARARVDKYVGVDPGVKLLYGTKLSADDRLWIQVAGAHAVGDLDRRGPGQ